MQCYKRTVSRALFLRTPRLIIDLCTVPFFTIHSWVPINPYAGTLNEEITPSLPAINSVL